MEKTKEKRGLGDNSNINTENYSSPLERNYWKDVADEACRLIDKLCKYNSSISYEVTNAINGRNNAVRGAHLGRAETELYKQKQSLDRFDKVIQAVREDKDLDVGQQKSDALDLVAEHGNFGCYIKNSNQKMKEVLDD